MAKPINLPLRYFCKAILLMRQSRLDVLDMLGLGLALQALGEAAATTATAHLPPVAAPPDKLPCATTACRSAPLLSVPSPCCTRVVSSSRCCATCYATLLLHVSCYVVVVLRPCCVCISHSLSMPALCVHRFYGEQQLSFAKIYNCHCTILKLVTTIISP